MAGRPQPAVMTAAEFVIAGRTIFGSSWQTDMAIRLGRSPRSIRTLVAGERPVNETIAHLLLAVLRERQGELAELVKQLNKRLK